MEESVRRCTALSCLNAVSRCRLTWARVATPFLPPAGRFPAKPGGSLPRPRNLFPEAPRRAHQVGILQDRAAVCQLRTPPWGLSPLCPQDLSLPPRDPPLISGGPMPGWGGSVWYRPPRPKQFRRKKVRNLKVSLVGGPPSPAASPCSVGLQLVSPGAGTMSTVWDAKCFALQSEAQAPSRRAQDQRWPPSRYLNRGAGPVFYPRPRGLQETRQCFPKECTPGW